MYGAYVSRPNSVFLGKEVTCDGYPERARMSVRVQTHIHTDHMYDFDRSLYKIVYASDATKDLIMREKYGTCDTIRRNLIGKPPSGEWFDIAECESKVRLFNSGHMLGSCMISVKEFDKYYLYTSDFSWPLEPEVHDILSTERNHDVLVIDATYGHPEKSRRDYTQRQVRDELLRIVAHESKTNKIKLIGARGRLQTAYQLISDELEHLNLSFTGSPAVRETIDIFHNHYGMDGENFLIKPNSRGQIHLVDNKDQPLLSQSQQNEIIIRLKETKSQDSYVKPTEKGYQISMTDHADFYGTRAMIELVDPKGGVLTVGKYAHELAKYIRQEMGYEACCAIMPVMRKSAA